MPSAASVAARTAVKLTPIKIGSAIDQMYALREQKRALEAKIEVIQAEYNELEQQLMDKMKAEDTNSGKGKKASVSITYSVVGNVTDWDKVYAYVKKTGFFHLFQRRLSDPAVRELFEQGKKIPGCEEFTKARLNLRSGI